ncbi:hypothetical protein [Nocardia sp. XZ_19_385]|uniref:hypothetical protein n=1 Tax=Nocardia sp. XZ_19_385 TaxID=2769488 RepID=UPI001E2ABEBC|nr:hypothetical protein [Nocardia sp. XZ_19_385]
MTIKERVAQPGRVARRVQAAGRAKSDAAEKAYAKRKLRAETKEQASPKLPRRRSSVMATRIPFVAAIIALLGCGLALTLLLTTRAAEDSYQLSDARSHNRKLSEELAGLRRDVEAADSAPELAARARELGMIPAKDPARLIIEPDGTISVIGDPTPAQGAPAPPLNTPPAQPAPQPHAQAHGEQPIPVQPPRKPGEANTDQAQGATAHTATPSPAPAAQQAAPSPQSTPSPVPSPIAAPVETPRLITESPVPQPESVPLAAPQEVAR